MNDTTRKARGLVYALLGAALLLPGVVQAAGLTQADTNGDNKISRSEANAAQDKSFERLDSNGDGALDGAEFDAGQPGLPSDANDQDKQRRKRVISGWFDHMDSNSDGKISRIEYQNALKPYFDRLDADGDGLLSADELQGAFHGAHKQHGSNQ